MSDVLISIVAAEARGAMPKDGDLKAKAEAAMRSAANHWMVLDPELQFKGALAALMLEYPEGSPEGDRVHAEVTAMRKLAGLIGALQSGVAVDFDAMAAEPTPQFERIGLADLWRAITK